METPYRLGRSSLVGVVKRDTVDPLFYGNAPFDKPTTQTTDECWHDEISGLNHWVKVLNPFDSRDAASCGLGDQQSAVSFDEKDSITVATLELSQKVQLAPGGEHANHMVYGHKSLKSYTERQH